MAAGDRLWRRTGATRERCRRTVSGGGFVGRNSGRRSGRHEVRPRRQAHSIRRSRAGVGCGQSAEAKSEMSAKTGSRNQGGEGRERRSPVITGPKKSSRSDRRSHYTRPTHQMDIPEFLRLYQLRAPQIMWFLVDDHDDNKPSFEVKTPGNRWRCYGCDRGGGSIDFVKTYKALSFLEAKRWLAGHAGISSSASPRPRTNTPRKLIKPYKTEYRSETPPDHDVYEQLLQVAVLKPSGRQYLMERCISSTTIATFGIGQVTDPYAILKTLLNSYSFARLNDAGLLTTHSTLRNPRFLFPAESLLFPFFEHGRVAYLQARVIKSFDSTKKWRNLNRRTPRIYNVDALIDSKASALDICEGVIDTLSAIELGRRAIGLMGIGFTLSTDQLIRLRGRQVNILLDWDRPGDTKSAELKRKMRRLGIVSTRKNRPSPRAQDLNEYLVELNKHP